MFEPTGGARFAWDGCNYMSEEEMRAFSAASMPKAFDPAGFPNTILDVRYGTLPEQILDVYLPGTGSAPFPVLFFVHGGAWSQGTKRLTYLHGVIGVTESGYAVVSVDYRLAPAVRFPEFLLDVKTAIRWARANAGEYGFDPRRFAIAGDSAGGYLSLMAAYTADHPEYAGLRYGWPDASDAVQAVCDMYGPTVIDDPTAPFYRESGVKRAMRDVAGVPTFYDVAFGKTTNPALLRLAGPLGYVHKNIPPTLILHGKQDGIVPYQHSVLLADRIRAVCGEGRAELKLYEDRNHGDPSFNTSENAQEIIHFLDRHLGGPRE
ncbi:MAG: alpha/beta hydrolase [Clostridiales Family XIII bacterium]|jgi:acetyl esterase/lipase|nr:alpha/beta hydrolase [Clostridiales Family XIII bacterium]